MNPGSVVGASRVLEGFRCGLLLLVHIEAPRMHALGLDGARQQLHCCVVPRIGDRFYGRPEVRLGLRFFSGALKGLSSGDAWVKRVIHPVRQASRIDSKLAGNSSVSLVSLAAQLCRSVLELCRVLRRQMSHILFSRRFGNKAEAEFDMSTNLEQILIQQASAITFSPSRKWPAHWGASHA